MIEEWAYHYPHGKASLLFHRNGDDVTLGSSARTTMRPVTNLLRPNALFLSTAATTNNPTLLPRVEAGYDPRSPDGDMLLHERLDAFLAVACVELSPLDCELLDAVPGTRH